MIDKLTTIHPLLPSVLGIVALLLAAVVVDLVVRGTLVRGVQTIAKRSSATWDDVLIEHRVFGRLAKIVPGIIV